MTTSEILPVFPCSWDAFSFRACRGCQGIIASLALTETLALICDIGKGCLSDVPALETVNQAVAVRLFR